MSVTFTKMKRIPRKSSKTICFDCRGYTHLKDGKCNTCGSTEATGVGIAFRPPVKDRVKVWESIRAAWKRQLERRKDSRYPYQKIFSSDEFFFAFRKDEFRDPVIPVGKMSRPGIKPGTTFRSTVYFNDRLPRKIRERAVVAEIK